MICTGSILRNQAPSGLKSGLAKQDYYATCLYGVQLTNLELRAEARPSQLVRPGLILSTMLSNAQAVNSFPVLIWLFPFLCAFLSLSNLQITSALCLLHTFAQ